jgi:glycerol uptake facilitator-like aquaporin
MNSIDIKLTPVEIRKYVSEIFGTFLLAIVVVLVSYSGLQGITPVFAAIILGLCVYTLGSISGSHLNPAVTLGALSIGKISPKESIGYIVSQLIGGVLALIAAALFLKQGIDFSQTQIVLTETFTLSQAIPLFLAEVLGTIIFVFGIASVIYGKVHPAASGVVIGGSLLVGAYIAAITGAAGLLNPAVALSVGNLNLVYGIAPIIGAVIAMNLYKFLKRD